MTNPTIKEYLLPYLKKLLEGKRVTGFCGLRREEIITEIGYEDSGGFYANVHAPSSGHRDRRSLNVISGLELLEPVQSSAKYKSEAPKPGITLDEAARNSRSVHSFMFKIKQPIAPNFPGN
jgi:hypothetical protein